MQLVDYQKKIGNDPTGLENPELLKMKASPNHGHNNTIVNGIGRIGFMTGGTKARWTDEEMPLTFLTKSLEFIEENKSKPFFLFYSLTEPHVPRMPSTMFKGKSGLGYRGDAILHDVQLGSARHLGQPHCGCHLAGKVGVVEPVRVPQQLARYELEVLASEGVGSARGEVREGHPVGPADARVHVAHLAGESMRREPLGHRIGIEECAIHALGGGAQDAMQSNGSCRHGAFSRQSMAARRSGRVKCGRLDSGLSPCSRGPTPACT
jgi:hypothetical protein